MYILAIIAAVAWWVVGLCIVGWFLDSARKP